MKIRHELTYAAPPHEVFQIRADPAFRARVCEAMDTVEHDVSVDGPVDDLVAGKAGELAVNVDMVQHTQGVPGFAKKIVGDQTRVVQTERWTSVETGHIELEIPGKPGHVRGTLTLTPDGSGSVYRFEGEAKVHIPLVGGKLEGLIEKLFVEGMDTEHAVASSWIEGVRS